MTSCSIYQPNFIPWFNFFKRMKSVDKFVILDHVQFQKNGLQNRNKIFLQNKTVWLTVPVKKSSTKKICDIKISYDRNWQSKHWKTILQADSKSPFFSDYSKGIENIYESKYENLLNFNLDLINYFRTELKIKTPLYFSSELNLNKASSDMIIQICKLMRANIYKSGVGGYNYLELDKFKENNIEVRFEKNTNDINFREELSILDQIFNYGADKLIKKLKNQ